MAGMGAFAAVVCAAGARWLLRAIRDSMGDVVTEVIQPHLHRLEASVETMRVQNATDHALVDARLTAVEVRLAAVENQLTPHTLEAHVTLEKETP